MKLVQLNKIDAVKNRFRTKLSKPGCLLASFVLLWQAGVVYAAGNVDTRIVEISPGIGYYNFDGKRELDSDSMAGVGLGLHFSRRWFGRLQYQALNSRNAAGQKVDLQLYHVDILRFFNSDNRLRPYLIAGFGQMEQIIAGNKSVKNMLNGGLGVSYKLSHLWTVRTDARVFIKTDNEYRDSAYMLTLGYRFGGGERDK